MALCIVIFEFEIGSKTYKFQSKELSYDYKKFY